MVLLKKTEFQESVPKDPAIRGQRESRRGLKKGLMVLPPVHLLKRSQVLDDGSGEIKGGKFCRCEELGICLSVCPS